MSRDDRLDPHLDFLELTDRMVEDLAFHNLKAREKLRGGIAWLEARRADATDAENADIEILLAQCHDAIKRMERLRDSYQDVRAVNAAAHAEHIAWLDKRTLSGTESPEERAERVQRLERLRADRRARMDELKRHEEERRGGGV
jgi:site-specific recombinase